jgi:hypothetical protein
MLIIAALNYKMENEKMKTTCFITIAISPLLVFAALFMLTMVV